VPSKAASAGVQGAPAKSNAPARAKKSPTALSYQEQRELDQLPDQISALEQEQQDLTQQLADPDLHAARAADVVGISQRLAALERRIGAAIERWEALESRRSG
jgi:ATP-binding cassette subfamily F protein uup